MMNPLNNSWIKLPRSFTSWRWYHDSKMVHVFLYFLLQANVKKTDYLSLTVYPGQVVTSLAIIAEDTGLSPRNIRTCLQKLSQTGEIKVHSSNKGTIVTIRDYSRFQQFSDEDATLAGLSCTVKLLNGIGIMMRKRYIYSFICCSMLFFNSRLALL